MIVMSNKQRKGRISSPLDDYRRAIALTDEESVHDVLVREGPQILKKGLPFLITAARWRKKDRIRKTQRNMQREVPTDQIDLARANPSIWDPYQLVTKNEVLHVVLDELSKLPDEDVLSVWDHFMGYSDKEIKKKWKQLSLLPKDPSLELIRKRRQRALEALRESVAKRLK